MSTTFMVILNNYEYSLIFSRWKIVHFLNVSGSVQQWPLPSSEFTWMEEKSLENVTKITQMIKSYSLSGSVGAILEVDIEYPAELHTRDRSFPLLCRNKKIQFKNLTRKQKKILRKNHPTEWNNKSFKASRLISSLKLFSVLITIIIVMLQNQIIRRIYRNHYSHATESSYLAHSAWYTTHCTGSSY